MWFLRLSAKTADFVETAETAVVADIAETTKIAEIAESAESAESAEIADTSKMLRQLTLKPKIENSLWISSLYRVWSKVVFIVAKGVWTLE